MKTVHDYERTRNIYLKGDLIMELPELQDIDSQKIENYRKFVNATLEIMKESGIAKTSIRKIAERAGFHNSTIYLYFEDLNQLIMLASVKYFEEYSHALELQSHKHLPPARNFMNIWEFFIDATLKEPCIFYNFFFGKRSEDLQKIMNLYYSIFPDERDQFSADIEKMYFGKDIFERSLNLLRTIVDDDNLVTEDNLIMLNEITVTYCEYKLMKKCQNPELDSAKIKQEILNVISYVTGVSI